MVSDSYNFKILKKRGLTPIDLDLAISKVIIKPSQNYSMVFADDCWIDTTSIRNEIREFVSKNKSAISMTYLNSFDSQTTKKELQWVSDILNFFTEGSSKTKSPH